MPNAWLCLEKDPAEYVAARDGYADELGRFYTWDDRVPNASLLKAGDYIALWDATSMLGVSVIERIEHGAAAKRLQRCPICSSTDVRPRKQRATPYKCGKCKAEFSAPEVEVVEVRTFTADYSAAWTPVADVSADQCRALTESLKSQHSMRPINLNRFEKFRSLLPVIGNALLDKRSTPIGGGHRSAVVRARLGQGRFRDRLFERFGSSCIFTGPAPRRVLQAAHLYRYSDLGKHEEDGGLLMRADLHLLFDQGLISVDPVSLCVRLDPSIIEYSVYRELHGRKLQGAVTSGTRNWLRLHWEQHGGSHR